ncbi:MAG: HAMP domain-containing sensor histidine kinase, partial [Bacteroidia bacterium]|nr:HAMP domain-containing sensor histidine kinase [Bacteroidia bacterium]
EEKEKAIDAGYTSDKIDVAVMIENALIVLAIGDNSFHLSRLDTLLTTHLNEKGNVVSSHITLQDTKDNKVLDEIRKEYIKTNSPFFIKSYTAERSIEIPSSSYLIKTEYRIKQPSYLQRLGIVTVVSFIASIIIISVLFYLLFMINRRFIEIANMERSFHGAIHDLKSPLAYVFFQLSLLEEEETDLGKKASLSLTADRVTFLTDKIMWLLKSARNINKIEEVDKEVVSLYDMLEQIENEMHTMFPKKKISFKYNVDADFTMRVLPDLMEASIRTIIENAVKYSSDAPAVEVSAIRDVENLQIAISDNGVGMTKQQMKNIFKPYYTSDKVHGNGIGLYYAQSIVKAHGGGISVTSNAGKGSTFLITLPNL